MHPQMVAAYIAKYATKAADDFGITARPMTPADVEQLHVGEHPKAILRSPREASRFAAPCTGRTSICSPNRRSHTGAP